MRNQLVNLVDSLITFFLLLITGLTPLLFLSHTTEFFEMPKLAFLMTATTILIGLWIFSWILKGKITITRTPLDIPLLLLLVTIIASTYFSSTRIAAIFGNFPKVHGSAASWITYILLYFATVSNIKSLVQIRSFLYVIYASATAVAVITLFSFFGLFIPFDFAQAFNFTPTGSTFSTIALLLLLSPLPLYSIINPNKFITQPVSVGLSILFGITIALVGSIPSYVILGIIYVICFIISKRQQVIKSLAMFLIPTVVVGLTLILAYVPISGVNFIQQKEISFPKEVQLPLSSSWKISASTFRDAPFIGTGPSSYVFNFTTYKPAEFNSFSFWNFSFDTAYNEFLQIMGTLGVLGLVSLVAICAGILLNSWKNIVLASSEAEHETTSLIPGLAVSGLVAVLLLFIHATTLVSIVSSLLVLAAFMASQKSIRDKVMNLSIGVKASTSEKQFDLFPVILFIVYLVAASYVLLQLFNTVNADYYHRQALLQANKNGTLTYQYLQRAETLNPYIDLYRVDMAQTNFALANALVTKKGPTKDNPEGSLTDQDKKTIQTLLSQSISEGRVAVALSPRSVRNWEVLASIYRNITGVAQNALAFSVDAYGRAIQQDPLNPTLRLNVGGIYYSAKNYDSAIRYFSDAANLKPDYTNAYFNLAIALRDNNDLTTGLAVAQRAVALLEQQGRKDTADYKTAAALVKDLKSKVDKAAATNQDTEATQEAPAAKTNSALQNQNISNVNVDNLNNPPQTTPLPTVRPNPNTRIPQTTPSPTTTAR